ncbi:hypothetical protein CBW56_06485 [Denitratisoma oestradiolicum]|nr:hypothetical protein CBW56_06485 [Denitratisoma oestradiolicum]
MIAIKSACSKHDSLVSMDCDLLSFATCNDSFDLTIFLNKGHHWTIEPKGDVTHQHGMAKRADQGIT